MRLRPTSHVKIVTVVLIVLMSATTFTTQRQLMMKNMPATALDNPFAKQQKMLLYLMPLFFAISGINFPIGVLLYWLTTNLWSMGQQFYVIRRMPAPGSLAEKALEERRMKSGKAHKKFTIPGLHSGDVQDTVEETPPSPPSRSPASGSSPSARSAADRLRRPAPSPAQRPAPRVRPSGRPPAATARLPAGTPEPPATPLTCGDASPPVWETPHPTPHPVPTGTSGTRTPRRRA